MPKTLKDTQDYKNSPVGKIPKDWGVYTLESCVRPDAQITYGIVQAGPHIENGIPYIRTGDMAGDRLTLQGLLRTSPQIAASYRRSEVRAGEIVCAIRATVGKVLEVPQELDGANLTQGTARIAPRDEINNHFLLWALKSDYVKKQFALAIKGTTFSEITLENLRKIQIALPSSKSEQNQIAEILDTIDSTIAHTSTLIAKLKQMKAGLLHDLLTRGLDENGKLRDEIEHPEQFQEGSSLGQIPKAWDVKPLSALTESPDSITYGVLKPGDYVPNGIPLLQIQDVIHGTVQVESIHRIGTELDSQYARTRLFGGEIVMSLVGTIGKVAQIPDWLTGANLHRNLARIAISPEYSSRFYFHYLQTPRIQQAIKMTTFGSTQSLLNLADLRNLLVVVPPLKEQQAISSSIDAHDKRLQTEEAYLNKLKEQKKGLMHDLLTGRVRVTDLKEIPA